MILFEKCTQSECNFEPAEITTEKIEAKLRNLTETKSKGVVGQHPIVLKNWAVAFAFHSW